MANLTPSSVFDDVYRIETTDPALGGPGGVTNTPIQNLTNRTEWLKDKIAAAGINGESPIHTGDIIDLKTPGIHIVLDGGGATDKPSSGRATILVSRNSDVGSGAEYYSHIYVDSSGKMFLRSYLDGIAFGAWKEVLLASTFQAFESSFVGAVQSFAMATAPTGWLKCNGAAVSRTTYSALFAKISTLYGPGNGSTTFDLPDMRGEFARGFDDGRGVDSGRSMGSFQDHQLEDHEHDTNVSPKQQVTVQDGIATIPGDGTGGTSTGGIESGEGNAGAETRPRNIALLYCIKY